jgi:hypothetical protein
VEYLITSHFCKSDIKTDTLGTLCKFEDEVLSIRLAF